MVRKLGDGLPAGVVEDSLFGLVFLGGGIVVVEVQVFLLFLCRLFVRSLVF